MKNLLIAFLILATVVIAYSQGTEKDLHSIKQIYGSNENIKKFFEISSLDFKKDTLYVILVPPMVCSRCEGLINPFIYEIKNKDEKAEVALLAFYPRQEALSKYLKERNFRADHIIASTNDSFLENFVFSSGRMQAPYILKMTVNGDMLTGKSTLGMDMDEDFIKWIHSYNSSSAKVDKKEQNITQESDSPDLSIKSLDKISLKPQKEIIIGETPDHPISKCLYPGLSNDLKYFAFMDELSFNIYIYKIADKTAFFFSSIKPDSEVEKMYIAESVSDSLYYVLKKMNIINSMFFGSTFLNDTLIISASLPNIFFQNEEKENLAYFNQVSYLYYNISSREYMKNLSPELNIESELTRDHINTTVLNNGKYFFIPVSKGWPISGHESLSQVSNTENPFLESFYNNSPIFAVYNNSGEFITFLGKLDSLFKRYRLGYSYSNPLASFDNGIYWITDSYSGIIKGYSNIENHHLSKKLEIFKNNIEEISPDEVNALEYIKSFSKTLQTQIIHFFVSNDTIYCIIKHGDYYISKTFNQKGKLLQEAFLPNEYGETNIESYWISVLDNEVNIVGLFSSTDKYKLVLFNPIF